METSPFKSKLFLYGAICATNVLVLALLLNYNVVLNVFDTTLEIQRPDQSYALLSEKELNRKGYTDNDISAIKNIMTKLLEDRNGDLVVFGLYNYDKQHGQRYITYPIQITYPGVYPIPDARYYLAQNQLYVRYLAHKRGECFQRYFEQTDTISNSCPIIIEDSLVGFLAFHVLREKMEETGQPLQKDYIIEAVNNIKARQL